MKPPVCPRCQAVYKLGATESGGGQRNRRDHGKYPMLLRCGHTLCQPCLGKCGTSVDTVQCPKCQKTTRQDLKGVSPDMYTVGLMWARRLNLERQCEKIRSGPTKGKNMSVASDTLEKTGGQPCVECRKPAHCQCLKCESVLCRPCFDMVHSKSFSLQKHQPTPLQDSGQFQERLLQKTTRSRMCSAHEQCQIEYYCNQDNQPICSRCVIMGEHRGHDVLTLEDKNKESLSEMEPAMLVAQETFWRLEKAQQEVSQLTPLARADTSSVVEEVKLHFRELHSLLQAREEQIIEDMMEATVKTRKALEDTNSFLENEKCRLEVDMTDATQAMQGNIHTLIDADLILDRLKMAKDIPCVVTAKDLPADPIKFSFDSKLKEVIGTYGSISSPSATQIFSLNIPGPDAPKPPPDELRIVTLPDLEMVSNDDESVVDSASVIVEGEREETESVGNSVTSEQPDLTQSLADKPGKHLVVGHSEKINMTHIRTPAQFYVQLQNQRGELETMQRHINHYCQSLEQQGRKDPPECLKPGSLVLAQFSQDLHWYRAVITKAVKKEKGKDKGTTSYKVFFMDYGNSEKLPTSRLRPMKKKFENHPAFAYECMLCNLMPAKKAQSWTEESVRVMLDMTSVGSVVMKVMEEGMGALSVDLMRLETNRHCVDDQPTSLRDTLIFLGLAHPAVATPTTPQHSPGAHVKNDYISLAKSRDGEMLDLVVKSVENPCSFIAQWRHKSSMEYLHRLNWNLQDIYSGENSQNFTVFCPKKGMKCVAKSQKDSRWYRGLVTEVMTGGCVRVWFVDYGHTECLYHTDVCKILQNHIKLPRQAIRCCLVDVAPTGLNWEKEAIDWFTGTVLERNSQIRVVGESEEDNVVAGVLYVMNPENKELCCVNAELARGGFARGTGLWSSRASFEGVTLQPDTAVNEEKSPSMSPVKKGEKSPSPSPVKKGEKSPSASPVKKGEKSPSPSPVKKEEKSASPSPVKKEEKSASPSPVEKEEKSASPSPVKKEEKSASPSPMKKEEKSASPSPVKKEEKSASPSPVKKEEKSASPSPVKKEEKSASPSPVKKEEKSAFPSPMKKEEKSASPSPVKKEEKSASPSPVKKEEKSASPSPVKKEEKSASPSPVKKEEKSASPSPVKKGENSASPSPKKDVTKTITLRNLHKSPERTAEKGPEEGEQQLKSVGVEVVVTGYCSPSHFFIQLKERQTALSELMAELVAYKTEPAPQREWKVGECCVALQTHTGVCHRAYITAVLDDRRYQVNLMDYGLTDTVPASGLRLLKQAHGKVECFAERCHLVDLVPFSSRDRSQWSAVAKELMSKLIQTKRLFVRVEGEKTSDLGLPVDLLVEEMILETALDPLTYQYISLVRQLQDRALALSLRTQSQLPEPEVSESETVYPEEVAPSTDPQLGQHLWGLWNPERDRQDAIEQPDIEVLPHPAPTSTTLTIMPTHIDSQGIIYAHDLQNEAECTEYMDKVDDYGKLRADRSPVDVRVGQVCLAFFSADESFYRARVLEHSETGVKVQYVDYGNTEVVDRHLLRFLHPEMSDRHQMAYHFSLYNLKPNTSDGTWSPGSLEFMEKWLVNNKCTALIKGSPDQQPVEVELLYREGRSISAALVTNRMAVKVDDMDDFYERAADIGNVLKHSNPYFPLRLGETGTMLTALVTHMDLPNMVYLQRCPASSDSGLPEDLLRFVHMMDKLNDGITHKPQLKELPSVGEVCCAQYSSDERWYRALVAKTFPEKQTVLVYYVDYGNSEVVSLDKLQGLPDQFRDMPAQALRAYLNIGQPDSAPRWTLDVYKAMGEAVYMRRHLVLIKYTDPLTVELFSEQDSQNGAAILSYQPLVDQGMVVMPKLVVTDVDDGDNVIVESCSENASSTSEVD